MNILNRAASGALHMLYADAGLGAGKHLANTCCPIEEPSCEGVPSNVDEEPYNYDALVVLGSGDYSGVTDNIAEEGLFTSEHLFPWDGNLPYDGGNVWSWVSPYGAASSDASTWDGYMILNAGITVDCIDGHHKFQLVITMRSEEGPFAVTVFTGYKILGSGYGAKGTYQNELTNGGPETLDVL